MNLSVLDGRKARDRAWKMYLSKADGSEEKASKLMMEDAKKEYAKNPNFWK